MTVNSAPPPTTSNQGNETEAQLFASSMQDVYFDYDSYDITQQYQRTLQADARFLQQHPNIKFTIEGHCDERGSTEYNLALGDNRANSTKQALVSLGIPADRIRTISYGKEKPFCTESTEACWAQNRRAPLRVPGTVAHSETIELWLTRAILVQTSIAARDSVRDAGSRALRGDICGVP